MRSVVLSGFMASGKSTLGALLARRTGLPFVDTDAVIAASAGESCGRLLSRHGEAAFRAREEAVVRPLLEDSTPTVIAVGGGALTNPELRALALSRAFVVTLRASTERLVERAAEGGDRPLLAGPDPHARASALLSERAAAYAECHGEVWTDALDEEASVDAVLALVERAPLVLPLGERSYRIEVVHDRPTILTDLVAGLGPSAILAVTDSNVMRARGGVLQAALESVAVSHRVVTLAPGERHKTLGSVSALWDAALGHDIDRDAVLVAFGGGVVGDLTGFAAATLLRGVRFVQAPTTLLAMVDASVGGKTGFDHPAGKNLIGAFHQPSAVVVDLANLRTLPPRELRAGLAEVVKIALLFDLDLVRRLERTATELAAGDPEALMPVIRRSIELKIQVVTHDERESGRRALLNFGHTVGHALEAHGRYSRYLHGEAVSLGMVAELGLGVEVGITSPSAAARASRLLEALGLPTAISRGTRVAAVGFLHSDKKRRRGELTLPLLRQVGAAELVSFRTDELVRRLST